MSAREELIHKVRLGLIIDLGSIVTDHDADDAAHNVVSIAEEHFKPRTITTAEELDALATGAVVVLRDSKGDPHPAQKGDYGWRLPFVDGFWSAEKLMAGCESAEVFA